MNKNPLVFEMGDRVRSAHWAHPETPPENLRGTVTGTTTDEFAMHLMYRVRWDDGRESAYTPGQIAHLRTPTEDIPGMFAPAPFPCTTGLLIAWLNEHYGFSIHPDASFHRRANDAHPGVVGIIQARYAKAIPMKDAAKGLFPSDAWRFVQDEEKRIRGGQQSFFREDGI